jgi:hypothetical protein
MVQVAAGFADSLALRSDGTVWAWGQNTYGQLGNGTTTGSSIPVQVSGLADVVAVAAGQYHSLALRSDGTVWAWGFKFADGASGQSSVPVQVPGLSRIVAIAAGQYHSLALKSDGTVWAWGYDTKGQLGNGGTAAQINPVQVWGLSGAVAIAAGGSHSLALLNGGTVDAWGSNSNGQLGNGTADSSAHSTAAAVPGLVGVTQLAAGLNHSLAVRGDGTGAAWGAGFQGQLGAGSPPQDSHAPTFVVIGNGAQVVFSGSTANHSLWLGQPHVGLSPGKLTFDAEPVGTPSPSLAETVTNNGVVPLQVGQATIIANALGADGDEFTITGDGCSNSTIAPGASCEIGVRFDPKVTGTPEAALRIPSNSPTSPDEPRLDPPRQVSTANRSANTITCTPAGIRHHKLALRCRLRHGLGHGKHRLTARLGRHAAHATIRGNARTVTIALPVPRGHRSYRLTITISGAISRVIEKIRV